MPPAAEADLDLLFPSSAAESEKPPLALRLAAQMGKEFDAAAYRLALDQFRAGLESPVDLCQAHLTRIAVETLQVGAVQLLFVILIIVVVVLAVLVAVGSLNWLAGLILLIFFLVATWLAIWSMANYLRSHLQRGLTGLGSELGAYLHRQSQQLPGLLEASLETYLTGSQPADSTSAPRNGDPRE